MSYTTEQVEQLRDQSAKVLALIRKRDQLEYDLETCKARLEEAQKELGKVIRATEYFPPYWGDSRP